MRKLLYILISILILSFVMSCGRSADRRLVLADTLMWTNPDSSLIILQGRLQIQQQISYLRGCDDVVRCSCRRTGDKQSAGCLAGIPAQSISHATKKPREGMERVPCLQRRHKQALWQVQLQVHLFLHAHVFPPHARIAGIPHLRQQAQAHICPPRIEDFPCKNSLQN